MKALRLVGGAVLASATVICAAQGFPAKPVRIVSPYPPGGGNDTLARTIAPKLTELLKQQVIVENKPGANTIIGTEHVARSAPDGYTMVLVPNSLAINPFLYPKIPYDAARDFTPISLVGQSPLVVAVHPSMPTKDVRALIELARTRPTQVQYGSSGIGSVGHMSVSLLEMMTGARFQHIPYKGTAIMMQDVLSGQLTFTFTSALGVMPHVRSGRLRAIAVTGDKRSQALPDLPTVAESGNVPGYSFILWYGLLGPANLPADVLARLNGDIGRTLQDADIRTRLGNQGVEATPTTSKAFSELIASDLRKYAKVVPASGAKAE